MQKSKITTKRIVLIVVSLLLIAVLIAGNCILNYYALIIHRFVAGVDSNNDPGSGETVEVDALADDLIQEAAAESFVLLYNDDNYLPLKALDKVNLFGYGSTDNGLLLTGGGSGGTSITDDKEEKVDLTDAFVAEGIEYNTALTEAYENYSSFDADWRSGGSTGANATQSLINPPETFYTTALMDSAYEYSKVAVAVLSRWGAENGGSNELVSIGNYANGTFLELTKEEKAMFNALQTKGFEVIVLLNTCNNLELGFLEDYSCIKACMYVGIPGQSGLAAVPKIITGEINPSGRISDTLVYDNQTYNPIYLNPYPSNSNIVYQESIYFGYKWYETADAEGYFNSVANPYGEGYDGVVQFPFGYGLSYTQFEWELVSEPEATLTDGEYSVKVKVYNTGDEAGKDVVQLYAHAPYTEGGIEKAERILLDFAKTPLLNPNSSCEVELTFSAYDLASYDDYDKNGNNFAGYEVESGNYEFYVMKNAHDVEDAYTFEMEATSDILFEKDPITGNTVENLFTGSTAYANCPIDGGITDYLSRANDFANFPKARASAKASNVSTASSYVYDGYSTPEIQAEVATYFYGEDRGLYLVQAVTTDAEGNETYSKATIEMLEGVDTSAELALDEELIQNLIDYDSEYWDVFLDQLTQDDIKNIIGKGGFQTVALESVGKPRCTDKDGPAGFNNNVTNGGISTPYPLFPSESLLGCSWNTEITYKIGEVQGKIAKEFGINGWYGPSINLHRSVFNSRNYEYYSEDAILSGKLAAETVKGASDNNLYCYVKHFAVSEEGQNPTNVNTWLTEQALRESYLKSFEITVKDGKANAMMSAFNRVGAVLSGYNHALLTSVLREEWGFRGSVITDWYTGSGYMSNHTTGVIAGNDLWLCGSTNQAAGLDFNNPAVAYAARRSAKNLLYTYVSTAGHVKINAEAHSPLVDFLWVAFNVIFAAGALVCIVFAVKPNKKNNKEQQ